MWGGAGRCGEVRGDVGRCGEMWTLRVEHDTMMFLVCSSRRITSITDVLRTCARAKEHPPRAHRPVLLSAPLGLITSAANVSEGGGMRLARLCTAREMGRDGEMWGDVGRLREIAHRERVGLAPEVVEGERRVASHQKVEAGRGDEGRDEAWRGEGGEIGGGGGREEAAAAAGGGGARPIMALFM